MGQNPTFGQPGFQETRRVLRTTERVQSTLLPNFLGDQGVPIWLFGGNPGVGNLATLNPMASVTRPIQARARNYYLGMTLENWNLASLLKSISQGASPDGICVKKRRHFDGKSRFLEILKIIVGSNEDHFLELLEAPGSSSTSLISRKSPDLPSRK